MQNHSCSWDTDNIAAAEDPNIRASEHPNIRTSVVVRIPVVSHIVQRSDGSRGPELLPIGWMDVEARPLSRGMGSMA